MKNKTRRSGIIFLVGLLLLCLGAASIGFASARQSSDSKHKRSRRSPIVIGHRGASGYRPEHTLASYRLAIDMGADFIEPDLVSTKDGVLVARHENEISATTDVENHAEFASRFATKTIGGVPVSGWFTEDFTLAELKTLRAEERIPDLRPNNTTFNGLYQIPTFQEVIDLAKREGVGIYPETKHPTYFDGIGLSLEEPLVRRLNANGYRDRRDVVYVQSFEVSNLKDLNRMTDVSLVQLINETGKPYDFVVSGDPRTYADMITPIGLREIKRYANGIGANKNLVIPRDASNNLTQPTELIEQAHAAGLIVHAWTFRNENSFLPNNFRQGNPSNSAYLRTYGNAVGEYMLFFKTGLDGVFSDHPDTAVASRLRLSSVRR